MATGPDLAVVVGAGLSGLVAARQLVAAGRPTVVLERAAGPGGRMATVRMGEAVFDAGAQFFTVRSGRFGEMVERWLAAGVAYEWCRGFGQPPDGHPRYAGRGGMATIARHLAEGIDVRFGVDVTAVVPGTEGAWEVRSAGGSAHAGAVVLTAPVPQCRSLLAGAELSEPLPDIPYDPTLGALAVPDGPPAVPPPGGVQPEGGALQFVCDNHLKGISEAPAMTLHATGEWSRRHWDLPDGEVLRRLVHEARGFLGQAAKVGARPVRWRWATPVQPSPQPCHVVAGGSDGRRPVVLAGDAFAGPKVEGAVLSGLAAAEAVLSAP